MPDSVGSGPGSDRVAQAIEVIRARRNCGPDQAYDLLREKAFMLGQTMEHTALDVLDDLIRFD